MVDVDYKKEYLPGYTGHVPKKNEICGCTAGHINKIITKVAYKPSNYDVDISVGKPSYALRDFYNNPQRRTIRARQSCTPINLAMATTGLEDLLLTSKPNTLPDTLAISLKLVLKT